MNSSGFRRDLNVSKVLAYLVDTRQWQRVPDSRCGDCERSISQRSSEWRTLELIRCRGAQSSWRLVVVVVIATITLHRKCFIQETNDLITNAQTTAWMASCQTFETEALNKDTIPYDTACE